MPIHIKDAEKLIGSLSEELLENSHFYIDTMSELSKEDDWSFVIKSHAFIEMFTSEFIAKQTEDSKFQSIFKRLPLSDNQIGKLAICKDLGLLDKAQRRFIKFHSELRNSLVHRFENIAFSFSDHINSLSDNDLKNWKKSIIWFPVEGKAKETWYNIAVDHPKTALWFGIAQLACIFNIDSSRAKASREVNKLALETSEKLLKDLLNNQDNG